MFFLFLDLEYTGFDVLNDQILEVGAVICKMEHNQLINIDSFQSLIKPTIAIPDHIPRLTGLEEKDFKNAPELEKVKKMWQEWIEKSKLFESEVVIIGHSVKMDIALLKVNHFWLPQKNFNSNLDFAKLYQENIPYCDTLDLAKTFLPDQSNLNLEYLVKNLKLDQKVLQNLENSKDSLFNLDLKPHRALYDTFVGIELFIFILEKINLLNLPESILNFLNLTKILPFKIPSLAQIPKTFNINGNTNQNINSQNNPKIRTINFALETVKPELAEIMRNLAKNPPNLLNFLEDEKNTLELRYAAAQIYIYLANKQLNPDFELRLHSYGIKEKLPQEMVYGYLEHLQHIDTTKSLELEPEETDLPMFERIISNVADICEEEFEFAKFSHLVDILADVFFAEFKQEFKYRVSVEMDFLAARMEFLIQQNPKKELQVNRPGYNNDLELNDIFGKFQKIIEKLRELKEELNQIPKNNSFLSYISILTLEKIDLFLQQNWSNSTFWIRLSKSVLKLTKPKADFEWSNYWYKLSLIPNLILTTFLDENGWKMLGDITKMPDDLYQVPNEFVKNLRVNEIQTSQNNDTSLDVLLELKQNIGAREIALVLCGQNSGLEKITELAIENLDSSEFLAIGETGSLAKISGKIRIGFSGLVIIKSMDIFMIKQISGLKLHKTALLIQSPHTNLNQFWFKDGHDFKDTINQTKRILRNSIIGQLSLMGATEVIFQPEIVK